MQLSKLINAKQLFKRLCQIQNASATGKRRSFASERPAIVLGIETSCDDTGIAIVDSTGRILGEAHNSQLSSHLRVGGINPPVAQELHQQNIQNVFEECLKSANMSVCDVDAIATTVQPGLPLSLQVGRDFGVALSKKFQKPFIPIHHMQAHALTARMIKKVEFPFLVLLISGGHCLLALAQAVDEFKILGSSMDDAPGEAFDKVARSLNLVSIPKYSEISGGQAIELEAKKADNPAQFKLVPSLLSYRDCNFSFSGLKSKAKWHIEREVKKHGIERPLVIPSASNLCAAFLMVVTKHLCMRTQRAMEFIIKKNLIPDEKRVLVVSGGVASNNFIAAALNKVCLETGFNFVRPPPKLCTDNGIMIAWNGIERFMINAGVLRKQSEIGKVDIFHRSPIGEDWSDIVANESIKRPWVKLKFNELIKE